jgi:hypothetical protein
VHLTVRLFTSYANPHTMILSDEAGPILALNKAADTSLLAATDIPGLRVEKGSTIAQIQDGCGNITVESLAFSGDETVVVAPGNLAAVRVRGAQYDAAVMISYSMVQAPMPCLDAVDQTRWWGVWRRH